MAVFWLMSILGLAVFTAANLLKYELDLVTSQVHGSRAGQFAEMGIAVAANPAVERTDPLLQRRFEGGGFSAEIKSEGARFNINAILANRGDGAPPDKPLLREMFVDWGMDVDLAEELVDALVDWVDEDEFEELNGAEFPEYEGMGYTNRPYNRPFYSLDEMRLVRGMDVLEQIYPNWRDWFTIWSTGGLDVNEAAPELLARALEVSVEEAQSIQDRVVGPDGIRGNEDDLPFSNSAEVMDLLGLPDIQQIQVEPRITANDQTVRIESTGESGDIRRRITLIVRNRTGRPTILERREELVP